MIDSWFSFLIGWFSFLSDNAGFLHISWSSFWSKHATFFLRENNNKNITKSSQKICFRESEWFRDYFKSFFDGKSSRFWLIFHATYRTVSESLSKKKKKSNMAELKKSTLITGKPNARDLKGSRRSLGGLSSEHIAGSKADKNRRRRSVTSQFAHPMTGETMKERQVKSDHKNEKKWTKTFRSSFAFFRTCQMFKRSQFLAPFYFIFLY